MKKILCLMLTLGLTATYAQEWDDEDEEATEQESAPAKKAPPPKKAKAASSSENEDGGLKLGFYGSVAGGLNITSVPADEMTEALSPFIGTVGVLLNLGSGLEFGLGLGLGRFSATEETSGGGASASADMSGMVWEIIPSVGYQIGKKDFISYGAGLDIHISSWSVTQSAAGASVTVEPDGMTFALYPNFFMRAEIVKNFQIGLKTGLMVYLPPDEKEESYGGMTITTSGNIIGTKTEVGFYFYL